MTGNYSKQVMVGARCRRMAFRLCPIDDISLHETLQVVQDLSRTDRFDYVVTPNMDHLQRLYLSGADGELRRIYRGAALSLCDSRILEKILALRGARIQEVIPGSSLTERLFSDVLTPASRILLVGGDDDLIARLRGKFPHLTLQHINPSMGFIHRDAEVENLVQEIGRCGADYIFLAVGSPQQELLASKLSQHLQRGVALCVGASLLFLAEREQRAPRWVQRCACEWAYRLAMNPRRLFKRYLLNFLYLPLISWSFISPFGRVPER